MNVLEYLKQGGTCKSKSGRWFHLSGFEESDEYPINGFLEINGEFYHYKWTKEGIPHNLPYTHCLDLEPVIPVITYKMVNKKKLTNYDKVEDFYKQEGNYEGKVSS